MIDMQEMFALCIENRDCADLEKRKVYQIIPDENAAREGYIRVIDESREDYLYPTAYFVIVNVPQHAHVSLLNVD